MTNSFRKQKMTGRRITRQEALTELGDPSTWAADEAALMRQFKARKMGPIEQLLRKTHISHKSLLAAYSEPEVGRLLVGARLSLGIPFSELETSFEEVLSEAIEAAAALGL